MWSIFNMAALKFCTRKRGSSNPFWFSRWSMLGNNSLETKNSHTCTSYPYLYYAYSNQDRTILFGDISLTKYWLSYENSWRTYVIHDSTYNFPSKTLWISTLFLNCFHMYLRSRCLVRVVLMRGRWVHLSGVCVLNWRNVVYHKV